MALGKLLLILALEFFFYLFYKLQFQFHSNPNKYHLNVFNFVHWITFIFYFKLSIKREISHQSSNSEKKKEKKQEFFAKGKQAGSISFKFIAVWKFEMLLISFDFF